MSARKRKTVKNEEHELVKLEENPVSVIPVMIKKEKKVSKQLKKIGKKFMKAISSLDGSDEDEREREKGYSKVHIAPNLFENDDL